MEDKKEIDLKKVIKEALHHIDQHNDHKFAYDILKKSIGDCGKRPTIEDLRRIFVLYPNFEEALCNIAIRMLEFAEYELENAETYYTAKLNLAKWKNLYKAEIKLTIEKPKK